MATSLSSVAEWGREGMWERSGGVEEELSEVSMKPILLKEGVMEEG
jgi:hypothetical protein